MNDIFDETIEAISDDRKEEVAKKKADFNDRYNTVSQRLKEMPNRDLPESSSCWFARFLKRRLFPVAAY